MMVIDAITIIVSVPEIIILGLWGYCGIAGEGFGKALGRFGKDLGGFGKALGRFGKALEGFEKALVSLCEGLAQPAGRPTI